MYVIGDTHGCYYTLIALLEKLPKWKKHGVVLAGDICDRGAYPHLIYDLLIKNKNIQAIKGNHDDFFAHCVLEKDNYDSLDLELWKDPCNGGEETLKAYEKIRSKKKIYKHAEYADNLPLYLEFKDITNKDNRHLVVSHNVMSRQYTVRDKADLPTYKSKFRDQLLWGDHRKIRDNPTIYNITGHMYTGIKPKIKKIYACIDTGCGYDDGLLTAIKFPEMEIFQQEIVDGDIQE